jgi:hypothetical protein
VPDALGGTRRASHSGREHRGGALGARTDSIRREPVRSGDPGTCREPDCFAAGAVICCNSVKEKPGQSRALRRLSVIVVTSCRGTRDSIGGDRPAGHHRSSRDRRNSRQQGHTHSRGCSRNRSHHYKRPPRCPRQQRPQRCQHRWRHLYQNRGPPPERLPLFQPPPRLQMLVRSFECDCSFLPEVNMHEVLQLPELGGILFEFRRNYRRSRPSP